jgi:hypothetical protein
MMPTRYAVGGGRSVRLRQHFFDSPVAQPRGSRRAADGTGLKVWPTAARLLLHVQAALPGLRSALGVDRRLRVLELGSGCGLLGIGLAATCDVDVLLTDPAVDVNFSDDESGNTLQWLQANVELNRELVGERARTAKLAWGDVAHTEELHAAYPDGFDLVVGSDLLYEPDRYQPLLSSLGAFAATSSEAAAAATEPGAPTSAILGYPVRHGNESRFLQLAADSGAFRLVHQADLKGSEGQPENSRMQAAHLACLPQHQDVQEAG